MTNDDTHERSPTVSQRIETDGGRTEVKTDGGRTEVRTDGGRTDVEREREVDYLDVEINLLKPATPFMQDHLRLIWTGFAIWTLTTFGPITLTRIAPELMTTPLPVIGFPLHYFLIAIGAPSSALILSVWYARKRDQIDEKYGITQMRTEEMETARESGTEDVAATDGGEDVATDGGKDVATDGGVDE